ncbi:glycine cleavage system aminomethyltransferase GcvT [Meridianimarinicoccus roseus]|uniref:aminomethyltransferase n=1 Tax=Meridianimarinicoccus roseus TaxID=2072018 RepID=A0A2V2L907_9RHOB|nr:glycine cleavage system aminomethyltransferase GcvT [Meridianimarinicoccus roseus]PWR01715.1 glycine cleavage system aminomethyltransferase GcvT [Meridianimarinicoccus roseus]
MPDLKRTPLYALHAELGAKMTPFAGYDMPVQYPMGVLKEHQHCRGQAGMFDVSHMGQVLIVPRSGDVADAARSLETLVPVNVLGLHEGRQRYGFFTNDAGGIEDDLMIANRGDHLFVVVNAACKQADIARMRAALSDSCEVIEVTDRALIALQGPSAEAAMLPIVYDVTGMGFMDVMTAPSDFGPLWISRSGYTGEDGFEISVKADRAEDLARALLSDSSVAPIGLGARDSLRLEAGLCLYGSDLGPDTTPVEADLTWAIQKVRRLGGDREGGFPGHEVILRQMSEGAPRKRVGLLPEGRAPMRAGTAIYADETAENPIGTVTSGAYGPWIEAPMSMGYLAAGHTDPGTTVFGDVRGKRLPATVTAMPFRPAQFKR